METKQEYYQALGNGNLPILEELIINTGYNPLRLSSLDGFDKAYQNAQNIENEFIKTGEHPNSHFIMGGGGFGGGSMWFAPINYLKVFNEGMFAINNDNNHFVAMGKTKYDAIPEWEYPRHYFKELNSRVVLYRGKIKDKLKETSNLYDELLMIDKNKPSKTNRTLFSGLMLSPIPAFSLTFLTKDILSVLSIPMVVAGAAAHNYFTNISNYGKPLIRKLIREAKWKKS